MSRRPRVPGTSSAVWRREIACGANPTLAVVRALTELEPLLRGRAWHLDVHHDDGCPAIETGPMGACTCELVQLEARRAA